MRRKPRMAEAAGGSAGEATAAAATSSMSWGDTTPDRRCDESHRFTRRTAGAKAA